MRDFENIHGFTFGKPGGKYITKGDKHRRVAQARWHFRFVPSYIIQNSFCFGRNHGEALGDVADGSTELAVWAAKLANYNFGEPWVGLFYVYGEL